MRVLEPSHNYPPVEGGITTHAVEVGRLFAAADDDVTFLVPPRTDGRPLHVVPGCKVRAMPSAEGRWSRLASTTRGIAAASAELAPDLVYSTHWRNTGIAATLAKARTGVPFVQAIHGTEIVPLSRGRSAGAPPIVFRAVARAASGLIALGVTQRDLLIKIGVSEEKIFTSPEGVDVERFDRCSEKWTAHVRSRFGLDAHRVITTVGRLVPRKGHDQVIRALPAIARAAPDVRYLIVGRGPEEERLRALAASLGVADRVVFSGYVRDEEVIGAYRAADVFVLPNREVDGDIEGFGISFVEAGYCGKPVVGGACHGPLEIVDEGVTGYLVDPMDTQALAERVVRLLDDRAEAARMGAAGRRKALEIYDYRRVVERIRAFVLERVG